MFALPFQSDPQSIIQFTKHIRQTSVPEFTQLDQFYQSTLRHILKRKNVLRFEYSKCLSQLLYVLYQKINQNPRVLTQYSSISKTMSGIVSIIDYEYFQGILNKLNGVEQQYIEQNKQTQYLRNFQANKQISQRIPRDNQLQKIQNNTKKNNTKQQNQNLGKKQFQAQTQLNYQQMTIDCMGCFQYFYQNSTIDLKNLKQDVLVFPSAKTIRNFQREIKHTICNLINNNGGFILFACTYKENFITYGQSISQVKKQSILQQFIQIFSCFVPKINFNTDAQLSFVPLAKKSQKTELIEGIFATRLKIWNNNHKQILTFYRHMGQLLTSYGQSDTNNLTVYKHSSILRQIKRRFKQKIINKIISLGSPLLYQTYDSMNHKCKKPQISNNLVSTYVKDTDYSNLFDLQKKYKYTSIVIAQKITPSKVLNLLISHNISRFQFMPKGTEYNDQIRLLFHDTSPHKIKQILQSFKMQKGLIRLLLLDNALQLKHPLNQNQFLKLVDFLSQTLSFKSTLEYYKSKKEQSYFVCCQSKIQIYYLFNKLRYMNFHGSRLVSLDTNSANIQKIYSC